MNRRLAGELSDVPAEDFTVQLGDNVFMDCLLPRGNLII
jgi:hypothetical protein